MFEQDITLRLVLTVILGYFINNCCHDNIAPLCNYGNKLQMGLSIEAKASIVEEDHVMPHDANNQADVTTADECGQLQN